MVEGDDGVHSTRAAARSIAGDQGWRTRRSWAVAREWLDRHRRALEPAPA
jgi:hypothetical protein